LKWRCMEQPLKVYIDYF